jgi:hypothetical protein
MSSVLWRHRCKQVYLDSEAVSPSNHCFVHTPPLTRCFGVGQLPFTSCCVCCTALLLATTRTIVYNEDSAARSCWPKVERVYLSVIQAELHLPCCFLRSCSPDVLQVSRHQPVHASAAYCCIHTQACGHC